MPAWSSADAYEPFMGRWSRRLADAAIGWAAPEPGLRWLDVGSGTGALSDAIVRGADPASTVGIDPAQSYVDAARARLPEARFEVGGAGDLPFEDSSFDQAACGLVLNFVPDVEAVLAEVSRVLVPDGRLIAYLWDYDGGMQMLRSAWDAATALDPTASEFDEAEHYTLCYDGALAAALTEAGYRDVRSDSIQIEQPFADFDDYWRPFLGGQGPAPGYIATLDDQAREALRVLLFQTHLPSGDGPFTLTAKAWIVSGLRPPPSGEVP